MDPVKIGLLLPSSGVDTAQGTDATKGFELYLRQAGSRAGGRELRLIKEDDRAKPDVAREKIRKLVEVDHVDFVIGPISSAVVLAIRDYVHESGVPLLVPAAFTRVLTSPQQASPSIFRLSDTSDQSNYPMGEWLMRHKPYRRMVVLAADFAGGRHSVEAFMAGFRAAGGEIVAEIYPPFDTADFSPYLKQIAAARGDAVYAWFAGGDAVRFVTQYRDSGTGLPLTGHSALVGETLLPLIGDAALGIIAVGAYSASIETPENRKFVRDYEAAYHDCPSRYSECGWDAAALISTAVDTLHGDLGDRTRVRKALRDALPAIKPPRGPMRFDDYRQVITPIYFTLTEKQDGRIVNKVIDGMPAVSQESTWGWWNKTP
jgi:branched-chain amino acid transport system substrate-binding protein